jgi:hypothetical protein
VPGVARGYPTDRLAASPWRWRACCDSLVAGRDGKSSTFAPWNWVARMSSPMWRQPIRSAHFRTRATIITAPRGLSGRKSGPLAPMNRSSRCLTAERAVKADLVGPDPFPEGKRRQVTPGAARKREERLAICGPSRIRSCPLHHGPLGLADGRPVSVIERWGGAPAAL